MFTILKELEEDLHGVLALVERANGRPSVAALRDVAELRGKLREADKALGLEVKEAKQALLAEVKAL